MRHQNYATHTILGKTDIKLGIMRNYCCKKFIKKIIKDFYKTRFIVKYPNIPY